MWKKRDSFTAWWKALNRVEVWLGLIVLVGLALRLCNLATEPYWGDEVLSLDIVRHFPDVGEMVRYLGQVEFHPPLYYLLLHPWVRLFGEGEAAVRALSVLFSLGVIVMTYVAGSRFFLSKRAGLAAAAVIAIMPMQIEYGQEARPYAIFCFTGLVAATCLWEHLRTRKVTWLVGYAVAAVAGLWLHYSAFFILGATATWWFIDVLRAKRGGRLRAFAAFVVAHAAIFMAFYPWLGNLLYKTIFTKMEVFGLTHYVPIIRAPDMIVETLNQLVWLSKGPYVQQIEVFGTYVAQIVIAVFAAQALFAAGKRAEHGDRERATALAYVGWLLIVPLGLFLLSPQSLPYSRIWQRHILFGTVPIALLLGLLISRLTPKRGAVLAAVLFASLIPSIANITADDALWDPDHRLKEAGEYISEHYKPGDMVIVSSSIVRTDLSHYLKREIPVAQMLPIPYYGHDVWNSRETLGLVENESQVRIVKPSPQEIRDKMDRLVSRHQPKRVWLYGFSDRDYALYQWFSDHDWRHAFKAVSSIFQVHLFAKR